MTSNSSRASKASAAASEPAATEEKADTAASKTVADAAPVDAPAETEAPTAGDLPVEPPLDKAPGAVPAAAPAEAEAPAEKERPKNHVQVVLAHPIDKQRDLTLLRLEPKEGGYKVNEEIWVHPDSARTLIAGGYAKGVHPEDRAAVEAALAPASTATEKA